ncbi:PAS domain-containing sensor histidine kinase [Haloarcula marina]|uniref:PAS domain-containing sensor histidine kinase n=1 Tax=Haloarcula marina TaxID=2961574 RepID=UPI0020B77C1D|nr:histidine kinase dimerization/phospho-acceptor domain-containing protein [Halomicroarcula marina]
MGQEEQQHIEALFADGGGRLGELVAPLSDHGFEITRIDDPATLATTATDVYDLVVVPHDETTDPPVDGVAGVETALDHVSVPVVLYAVGFPGADVAVAALDAGAADAVYVPPEREELLARRFRCAVLGNDFGPPEQLLEDFFAHYPADAFVKDDLSRIAIGSQETTRPQGYSRDQLVGLTDYELFHPDLADALYEQEQRIREADDPQVNVVEHFIEDGEDRWVASTKVPRYGEGGEVTGIVGETRDVTRLRRREQLVAALNEGSRDLMRAETTADICRVTLDIVEQIGILPSVELVLYDGTTLRPADISREMPDVFEAYGNWFRRAVETGDPQYVATGPNGRRIRTEAGDADDIEAVVLPLGDHGVLGMRPADTLDEFTLDLANVLAATVEASLDRAERERQLRERERELETQNQRLEAFTTMVSHDLRNPLQVAVGATDMLEEHSEHVERIYTSLGQMDRLVDELLTLARQGEITGDRVAVDVAALAGAAWGAVDTGEATLELDDPRTVVADEDRLRELLENLFSVLLKQTADAPTIRVGHIDAGITIEQVNGVATVDEAPVTRPLDTADWTHYGQYIVSTIAEAYGWEVSTADEDGEHIRFEITGLEVR